MHIPKHIVIYLEFCFFFFQSRPALLYFSVAFSDSVRQTLNSLYAFCWFLSLPWVGLWELSFAPQVPGLELHVTRSCI